MACRLVGTNTLSEPNTGILLIGILRTNQWNKNQNSYIFIQQNTSENVVCEMSAILSLSLCVNKSTVHQFMHLEHKWHLIPFFHRLSNLQTCWYLITYRFSGLSNAMFMPSTVTSQECHGNFKSSTTICSTAYSAGQQRKHNKAPHPWFPSKRTRAPSQYKDRLIYVRWFPC